MLIGKVEAFILRAICDVAFFQRKREEQVDVPSLKFRVEDRLLGLQTQQTLAVSFFVL
jgi:hypothetical protein